MGTLERVQEWELRIMTHIIQLRRLAVEVAIIRMYLM